MEVTEVGDTVSDVPKGKQNRKNTKSTDSSKAKGASSKQLTLKAALGALLKAIDKFEEWLEDVIKGEKIPEGYILMQRKDLGKDSSNSETQSSSQVLYFAHALTIC
ncbi:hypothetical protein POM88_015623 [Heracleum sosnowskyi]|uniref:Uncharacterized protein n=1 Tax=Heracleum sosnowskyi TaxID=360622 RepID=A0AAD8IP26_9APIA|nr:hypothetical protein POM88_015623 [Heracleum sosnowskyi]